MSHICRRIVSAQPFAQIVERRRRNFLHLVDRLKGMLPLVFDELPPGVCPLFFPVLTSNKVRISERLFEAGIESVNFWSLYDPHVPKGMFSEVDQLRQNVLELPCHQDVSPEDIERLARELWKMRGEL
jgi:perosamine synthetase